MLRRSFFIPTRMCDIIFDIIFVPELHLNLCWRMIETFSDPFFGILQQSLETFRESSEIFQL